MKKNFVHICEELEATWLGKDNAMIPIYTHEVLGYESEIVTCNLKNDLPDEYRGVKITKIPRWIKKVRNFLPIIIYIKRIPLYCWIIKNAKNIDILMLFHITKCSYWEAMLYRKFNPNGKIYVKADFNPKVYDKEMERQEIKPKNLREFFRKRREINEYNKRKKLVKIVDLISYETKEAFEKMKDSYAEVSTKNRTIYLPNGYDDKIIDEIEKKSYEEKENIFITVGRLGTYEKNTELILEALEKVDLKDWKFYLIGSITDEFQKKIEEFYKKNPTKKEKVIFLGEIKNKKELYEYYNKAKVFVLTSRWESFGIVLVEALAFNNYILSTKIGAINDIFELENVGEIVTEKNLSNKIESIISRKRINFLNLETKEKFKYTNIIKGLKEL